MNNTSFYIYGKKPIYEQLINNHQKVMRIFISENTPSGDADVTEIMHLAKQHRIPFTKVGEKKMKRELGDVNDQGVMALIRSVHYLDINQWLNGIDTEENLSVLVLDHVQDTHNFGAILRTAAAYGVSGVIVSKDHQAPVNATVFKTSAGTATKIPLILVSNINQAITRLKENKFWVAAVDMPESKKDFVWNQDFTTPTAFVVGGESKGVSHRTKELCDFVVSLPLENMVESLNVSVATACVLYEWKRQQEIKS
jgi:23S rRNA (guanosine2251-2'-O)-methyltransferase